MKSSLHTTLFSTNHISWHLWSIPFNRTHIRCKRYLIKGWTREQDIQLESLLKCHASAHTILDEFNARKPSDVYDRISLFHSHQNHDLSRPWRPNEDNYLKLAHLVHEESIPTIARKLVRSENDVQARIDTLLSSDDDDMEEDEDMDDDDESDSPVAVIDLSGLFPQPRPRRSRRRQRKVGSHYDKSHDNGSSTST